MGLKRMWMKIVTPQCNTWSDKMQERNVDKLYVVKKCKASVNLYRWASRKYSWKLRPYTATHDLLKCSREMAVIVSGKDVKIIDAQSEIYRRGNVVDHWNSSVARRSPLKAIFGFPIISNHLWPCDGTRAWHGGNRAEMRGSVMEPLPDLVATWL